MSKRRKTQHAPPQTPQEQGQPESAKKSWIELATDSEPNCKIPVLGRFQAELPDWSGNRKDPDSEKWLGEQIWAVEETSSNGSTQVVDDNKEDLIGKGRAEMNCSCGKAGSVECVNHHISEERKKVKIELGPAFERWRFDNMGEEEVSKTWFSREEKKFAASVKKVMSFDNKNKNKKTCTESETATIRGKDKKSLVSYYFNVYTPRRIGKQTRCGCTQNQIDTDGDDDDDDVPKKSVAPKNNSSKKGSKSKTNKGSSSSSSRKPKSDDKSQENSAGKDTKMNKYLCGNR